MDTNFTVAYQAFAFLFCLLAASIALGWRARARFAVSRVVPRYGTVGIPILYRVEVRNETGGLQADVAALEELPDPRPTWEQFRTVAEPGERRRNWFDRAWRFHRWRWLLDRNRMAACAPMELPLLPPGEAVEVRHELYPRHRGVLRLQGVTFGLPDPFGLFRGLIRVECPESIVILPRRYPLPAFELPGSPQYQPGGIALASQVGRSEEFVSLRDYQPGDPMRHIHWRSWAKTGKPITKEFQDEFFCRYALVLDTFDSGKHEEVFEEAISVAASFASTVPGEDSLLDLMFVGVQAYRLTAGRGLAYPEQMLEVLAAISICRDRSFSDLERLIMEHVSLISGCVCVFMSWDEPRRQLLRKLQMYGVPTSVYVIVSPDELPENQADLQLSPNEMGAVKILKVGRIAEILAQR
jgi:uncharacterized protein (DUF58 family)